eukprot:12593888-Prorocentrum_lima.AAC.1
MKDTPAMQSLVAKESAAASLVKEGFLLNPSFTGEDCNILYLRKQLERIETTKKMLFWTYSKPSIEDVLNNVSLP